MEEPSGLSFETMMLGFFGKRGTREREEKGVDRQILIEPRLEHLLKIKFSEELGEKIEKENGFQEVFPLKMNFVIFISASPSYDILLFHHSWKKRIFGYRERKIRFSCKSEQMVRLSLQRFFLFSAQCPIGVGAETAPLHGSAGGKERISFEEFPNEFEAITRILTDCEVSGEKKIYRSGKTESGSNFS